MTYDNIYKIGISDKPKKRLSTFKTANPKISLVCYSDLISFAPIVEAKLHKLFKDQNVGGEWFELAVDQIEPLIKLIETLKEDERTYAIIDKIEV